MIFCSECFRDSEIKSIISKSNRIGDCPICGKKSVATYDTDIDDELTPLFDSLISVYTPQENFPEEYPNNDAKGLAQAIKDDWNIFSDIACEAILQMLQAIAPSTAEDFSALFDQPVGIIEKYDSEYLKNHSILRTAHWADFVETIKHKNRFHTNLVDAQRLQEYCVQISEIIVPDKQRFYRGRIARDKNGYTGKDMGAPPPEKATDGRANSVGISRLYLTNNRETTFHEIRAAEYDYVTVGTFKLMEPINVVNLSRIGEISPFGEEVDLTALAINREHLKKINQEMAHPMRRGDSVLDYLPTQFISDLIMSIQDESGKPMFDGIRYQSAMHSKGSNFTIFYPQKFKCTSWKTYEVTKLKFGYHERMG